MASANINDKLIIFKGDDTGGVFGRRLAFTIEAGEGVDLSGCRAEWIFDGIAKEIQAPLVPGEVREVFYSHNETRCMALGVRYGTFRIIDAAGKVRTLTNTKAVEVTDNVSRCYPGASSASFVVRGIGDVRHSEFADLETKDGMTLKEVGNMVNALIRKLKGSVAALAAVISFSVFSEGLGPQTEFGDVPPSATLTQVVTAGGGCGGVDTNAVREIAGEVVAPVEAAVSDRYTKAEADWRFLSERPSTDQGRIYWDNVGGLHFVTADTLYFSAAAIYGLNFNFIGDKPTTLSGYGITDAYQVMSSSFSNDVVSVVTSVVHTAETHYENVSVDLVTVGERTYYFKFEGYYAPNYHWTLYEQGKVVDVGWAELAASDVAVGAIVTGSDFANGVYNIKSPINLVVGEHKPASDRRFAPAIVLTNDLDVAVGGLSNAVFNSENVAIGLESSSTGSSSSGLGTSTAVGRKTEASADYSTAIGYAAKARQRYSTALGQNAKSDKPDGGRDDDYAKSTALGYSTTALGLECSAVGAQSVVKSAYGPVTNSFAAGRLASVKSSYAVAIGESVSIGEKASKSVVIGSKSSVAEGCGMSIALGEGVRVTGNESVAIGRNIDANGSENVVIGPAAKANIEGSAGRSVSIGLSSVANSTAVSIGRRAGYAGSGVNSVSIGNVSAGAGANAVAIGTSAAASAVNSIQLGEGINDTNNSLKFRNTVVVDGSGKIPSASLEHSVSGVSFDFKGGENAVKTVYDQLTNVIIRLGGKVVNPIPFN